MLEWSVGRSTRRWVSAPQEIERRTDGAGKIVCVLEDLVELGQVPQKYVAMAL